MNYMRLQEQNAGDLYKMITDETAAREKLGKALILIECIDYD